MDGRFPYGIFDENAEKNIFGRLPGIVIVKITEKIFVRIAE